MGFQQEGVRAQPSRLQRVDDATVRRMSSSWSTHIPAAAAACFASLLLTACSSDDGDKLPPPPAPETLFADLPAATPEKLRGVWQNTSKPQGGTVELRLRFMEHYVVGAAKCTADGSDTPVIAGSSIGLETTALDAASGKATFATLGMVKEANQLHCEASVPGAAYDFTIKDGVLSFTTSNAKLNVTFTKVGD